MEVERREMSMVQARVSQVSISSEILKVLLGSLFNCSRKPDNVGFFSIRFKVSKDVLRFVQDQPVSSDENRKRIESCNDDTRRVALGDIIARIWGSPRGGIIKWLEIPI